MKIKILAVGLFLCLISSVFSARVPLADIQARKDGKKAISLFQPWRSISGGILDTAGLHRNQMIAIHDLVFHNPKFFGLIWDTPDTNYPGLAESFVDSTIPKALAFRAELLKLNPNIILIGEVRYYDAPPGFLPPNSSWWMGKGSGYEDYQRLDYADPGFQTHVANQCIAMLETGVVDGCLMDWAKNDHAVIFKKVRELIGPDAVLLGNVNHHEHMIDQILPHLSGTFMECGWWSGYGDDPPEFFRRVRETIRKAMETVRQPKIINTEIWSQRGATNLDSSSGVLKIAAGQMNVMRAGVAVHYCFTNGYYAFYPQTFRDVYMAEHMHIYDDFFNAYLGAYTPGAPTMQDGAYRKEWENGTVIFNPPNNPTVTLTFAEPRRSQASGTVATTHTVPGFDGDVFLKGNFPQIYAKETRPGQKQYPDTSYVDPNDSNLVAVVPGSYSPKSVQINTIIRNNGIIFEKLEPGKAAKYYNTEGRKINILEESKK